MEYILSKSAKVCLSNLLLIIIIIGIGLLILGDKESDTVMSCFLIIAGVIFYYFISCLRLVIRPKYIHSNNVIDV
jgi:hypothetical protein